MDGLEGYYAKWSKSDIERQILYVITYIWNLNKQMNQYNKIENRLTNTENKQVVTNGEKKGEGASSG